MQVKYPPADTPMMGSLTDARGLVALAIVEKRVSKTTKARLIFKLRIFISIDQTFGSPEKQCLRLLFRQ